MVIVYIFLAIGKKEIRKVGIVLSNHPIEKIEASHLFSYLHHSDAE